jgi:uncharacterized protein YdeI (YjbR/CyaY-like superfamily)
MRVPATAVRPVRFEAFGASLRGAGFQNQSSGHSQELRRIERYEVCASFMTEILSGLPILYFADSAALEAWLAAQESDTRGVWIKLAKKMAANAALTKAQAIDVALCHGWIDGRLEKYDDSHWLVRFTPRKPRSNWSANNRKRALELIEQGRMRPAGLAQVEAAKADGRWDNAYAPASRAEVPDDLRQALDENPEAAAFFAELDSQNRYAVLYRISIVKKAETRSRKIMEFVAMLASGQKIHG